MKMPLVLRDEVIGEIVLEMERDKLSDDEVAFVNNVTTQTAIALENARLLQETERRAIQEQKLNELATRFSRAISIDEILRVAAQELGQLPTVADVSVQLNPVAPPSEPMAPTSRTSGGNGKERSA
jgi:GAF domain-containing protein